MASHWESSNSGAENLRSSSGDSAKGASEVSSPEHFQVPLSERRSAAVRPAKAGPCGIYETEITPIRSAGRGGGAYGSIADKVREKAHNTPKNNRLRITDIFSSITGVPSS